MLFWDYGISNVNVKLVLISWTSFTVLGFIKTRINSFVSAQSEYAIGICIRCSMFETNSNIFFKYDYTKKVTSFWHITPCSLVEADSLHWWWRQYAPLKRRSTSTRVHGAISQRVVIFIVAAVRTCNLTRFSNVWTRKQNQFVKAYFVIKTKTLCRV
jgi:hypothetical protein